MSMRVDWVDISHWQDGAIDFGAAKKAGVKAVFHKATENTGYRDPNFTKRRMAAKRAGMPFGAYHFAKPATSSGSAQASFFLQVARPGQGDMLPMLDLEDRGGLSQAQLTRWVAEFVAVVKKAVGRVPFIYTPFALDDNFGAPLWVARYSNAMKKPVIPHPWSAWTVWQFSNGVYGVPNKIAGFGHVDLNHLSVRVDRAMARYTLGAPGGALPAGSGVAAPKQGLAGFGTLNLKQDNHGPDWRHDLDVMWPSVGVLALQECRNAGATLKAWGHDHGVWVSDQSATRQHDNVTLVNTAVWKVDGSHYVRSFDGMSGVFPVGFNEAIDLTHKATGKRIRTINVHLPVHAAAGMDHADFRIAQYKAGLAMAEKQMAAGDAQGRTNVLLGDLNKDIDATNEPWDPHRALTTLRFDTPRTAGTLDDGRVQYDAVATDNDRMQVREAHIVKGLRSDHNGVWVKYGW